MNSVLFSTIYFELGSVAGIYRLPMLIPLLFPISSFCVSIPDILRFPIFTDIIPVLSIFFIPVTFFTVSIFCPDIFP